MAENFWRAERDKNDPARFHYTPPPIACVGPEGRQFFMGGAAMASAIDALERHFEKPLLWATTHFLNHGMLGEAMTIEIEKASGGHSVVQAMATMRRDATILHRTIAALGAREGEPDRAFITMPDVPPPEDCLPKDLDFFGSGTNLVGQFEKRSVLEDNDAGLEYVWTRTKSPTKVDAAYLVLLSDFFLGAHARTRRGTSLDNTFRLINIVQTEWILSATQFSSFTRGAVHGTMHGFARDGSLLFLSSQTGLLPRPL